MLSDDQGIWIGTNAGGLAFRSHDGKWIIYNTQNSELLSNDINTLIKDKRGGLWIGTHWGGLVYRNSNGQWKHKYKLPDSRVITLLTDSREGLWIGTALLHKYKINDIIVAIIYQANDLVMSKKLERI